MVSPTDSSSEVVFKACGPKLAITPYNTFFPAALRKTSIVLLPGLYMYVDMWNFIVSQPPPPPPPPQTSGHACAYYIETAVKPIYFTLGKTSDGEDETSDGVGDGVEAGSTFSIADIGEGDKALFCHTPYAACCKKEALGEFRYPNGDFVPRPKDSNGGVHRNRGKGYIRLNIPADTDNVIIGEYQCCVPNGCGTMECVSVTLTSKWLHPTLYNLTFVDHVGLTYGYPS